LGKAFVVSDLHLFSARADFLRGAEAIEKGLKNADYCVLNGDIFDFEWSLFDDAQKTAKAALRWLDELASQFPKKEIHYVMGNHDAAPELAALLSDYKKENFFWHPAFFERGGVLFLHGDLPLEGKNLFERHIREIKSRPQSWAWLDKGYDAILALRIHLLVVRLLSIPYCLNRITESLARAGTSVKKYRSVCFGHTHRPFCNVAWKGVPFHNSGSAVRHSILLPLLIEDGN
jgi:UDP-2,3-diacylglucosamine hydrolase